jgi:hypothetical protein
MYDFGNFKLDADLGVNRWYRRVVMFSGNLFTPRTMAMIEFEMPCEIESQELCAALIAYHLRGHGIRPVWWLIEGGLRADLLPWRREQAAYSARPQCTVGRDWLRLALKPLADRLASLDDEDPVFFNFEAGIFSIKVAAEAFVMAGQGASWQHRVTVPAKSLRNLPKRLMRDPTFISLWASCLIIGRHDYKHLVGVTETTSEMGQAERQGPQG